MKKLICGVILLGVAGYGGYYIYKTSKDANIIDPEDTWIAGQKTISGTVPVLPIHPKSDPTATQGVYTQVYSSYGKKAIPARNANYMNNAQLVPTTGPGNLAPIAGNTMEQDFVGINVPTDGYGSVTAGGPCPPNAGTNPSFKQTEEGNPSFRENYLEVKIG
jgi:hypothetical protein